MDDFDEDELSPVELIEEIVLRLVDHPDDVHVIVEETKSLTSILVSVHDNDVGKVLGRSGVYADAMRRLFGAIYGKNGRRLHLHVSGPDGLDRGGT